MKLRGRKVEGGDVVLQEKTPLGENETAADLHERFGLLGGELLVRTLDGLADGSLKPRPQDHERASFAPLLTKADGNIDWTRGSLEIHNKIRGLCPWPGATTTLDGQRVKVLKSRVPRAVDSPQKQLAAGEFTEFGTSIFVGTGNGQLEILELQPEGKRAMLPQEFANGIRGKRVNNETSSRFGT